MDPEYSDGLYKTSLNILVRCTMINSSHLIPLSLPFSIDCISGGDEKDSTCLTESPTNLSSSFDEWNVKGLRIGVPIEYDVKELQPEIRQVWQAGLDKLKAAGATVHQVSLPHTKFALPTYYIIATAEASSNLSRYDGVRYGSWLKR